MQYFSQVTLMIILSCGGAMEIRLTRVQQLNNLLLKWVDLIFTDQPNCVIENGIRHSLDNFCHHQITYCRMNFQLPPPPSFERKIWHYDRENITLIRRCISCFPWSDVLNKKPDPNWQAETFTEILLNIMTNFIPNETITVKPRNPPWITKPIKTMLNKQSRLFKISKNTAIKLMKRTGLIHIEKNVKRLFIIQEKCT